MSETIELPVTEAMTTVDLARHRNEMKRRMGAASFIGVGFDGVVKSGAMHLSLYPNGIVQGSPEYIVGDTWPEIISAAYLWIANNAHISRNATIRRMALAIIELTDEHGKCTAAMLTRRDFSRDLVQEYHQLACERAGEMAAGAPFAVEF